MRCIASHLVAAVLLAGSDVAGTAVAASPVKIVVFPFELMDFSAAAPYVAPDDIDREQLRLSTEEARRLIAESGRYQLVDVGAVQRPDRRKQDNCAIARAAKPGSPPDWPQTSP